MGSGKTYIIIYYCLMRYENHGETVFVVVCPPSVFGTWEDEIALHIKESCGAAVRIVHGARKAKVSRELRAQSITRPTFVLTSYDTLDTVQNALAELPIKVLVFDESNKIKNEKTKRTKTAFEFMHSASQARICCLSGTPSMTNPIGFYTQYEILGMGRSGFASFAAFESEFTDKHLFSTIRLPNGKVTSVKSTHEDKARWLRTMKPKGSDSTYGDLGYSFSRRDGPQVIQVLNEHYRYTGFKNIERLNEITRANAYSVEKKTILPELPDKTYVRRSIGMSPEQRGAYDNLLDTNRATIKSIPFTFAKNSPHAKLHQIAQGYILHDGEPVFFDQQPKMQELLSLLDENPTEKVVIWSPFPAQIEQVERTLTANKIGCVTFYGQTNVRDRADIVRDFQKENGPRCFVGNPSVGGLGINLTSASLEIFLTNGHVPEERFQAEDRCHRMGQRNPVTIVDLVTAGTLEAAILRKTLNRIDVQGQILSMSELTEGRIAA